MSDPRQEFVKAMKDILLFGQSEDDIAPYCRRACIAFADAECLHNDCGGAGEHVDERRRAALLRECGLEERDDR